MTNRFLLFLMLAFPFVVSAQRNYFVYIQAEPREPFYVRIGSQVQSSSASGYLVISQLKDSAYIISVGFPNNKYPQADYPITVNRKDHGFLLKNFGEKGWGLFNLQTLAVLMPVEKTISQQPAQMQGQVNTFTDLLSRAADDSTLRMKPVVAKKEEPVPVAPAIITDTVQKSTPSTDPAPVAEVRQPVAAPVTQPAEEKPPVKEEKTAQAQSAETQPPVKDPVEMTIPPPTQPIAVTMAAVPGTVREKGGVISLLSSGETEEGKRIVFLEKFEDGTADTVDIVVPMEKSLIKTAPAPVVEEKKFLSISSDPATETNEGVKVAPAETNPPTAKAAVPSCKAVAKEEDFVKLRRKMVSRSNDDDMIAEALRYFKSKCFSTEHIRHLSSVFLSDAGKYNFFAAARTYTSDKENFSSLVSELKTAYQQNRFKNNLIQ